MGHEVGCPLALAMVWDDKCHLDNRLVPGDGSCPNPAHCAVVAKIRGSVSMGGLGDLLPDLQLAVPIAVPSSEEA